MSVWSGLGRGLYSARGSTVHGGQLSGYWQGGSAKAAGRAAGWQSELEPGRADMFRLGSGSARLDGVLCQRTGVGWLR